MCLCINTWSTPSREDTRTRLWMPCTYWRGKTRNVALLPSALYLVTSAHQWSYCPQIQGDTQLISFLSSSKCLPTFLNLYSAIALSMLSLPLTSCVTMDKWLDLREYLFSQTNNGTVTLTSQSPLFATRTWEYICEKAHTMPHRGSVSLQVSIPFLFSGSP